MQFLRGSKVTVYTDGGTFDFKKSVITNDSDADCLGIREGNEYTLFNGKHIICVQIEDPEEVKDEEV